MPLFYAIAVTIAFAFAWPFLLLLPKLRAGTAARFGRYPPGFLADRKGPRVWLHGASAGDLLALLPVYRELRRLRPDALFVVSCMTDSGEAIARKRFADADAVTFLPWDLPRAVARTVHILKPDLLVLEYTELWPALIREMKRRGGAVALTNGRFSERNLSRYRWLFRLFGNVLRELDLLLMREDAERERALALGAPPERVVVAGNTKFDTLLLSLGEGSTDALAAAFGLREGDRLWVAGSTHEGEEALLLDVFVRLRADFPELRLAIAPRYMERTGRIAALARERSLPVRMRSSQAPPAGEPVLLLDTIGELVLAYRLASLVFVGGSFVTRGGQNILEPAACGRAVLFGPHMENFHDAVQVLVGRGGIQVNDATHLHRVAHDLLARPERLAEVGALARDAVGSVRGASVRNAEALAALLDRTLARRAAREAA